MKKCLLILLSFLLLQSTSNALENKYNAEHLRLQKEIINSGLPFTPLGFYETVASGDVSMVEKYLKAGMNPNVVYIDMDGLSAAISMKNDRMVDFLLQNGADPNKVFGHWTPLNFAIWHDNDYAARKLMEQGADINKTSTGGTPLDVAVFKENYKLVKLLFDKKAAMSSRTTYIAIQSKHDEIRDLFMQNTNLEKLEFLKIKETLEHR